MSEENRQPGAMWRSLDELAQTPAFQELVEREFPEGATEWTDPVSRREFLKVMSASLALAGVYGCSEEPREKIVPYVYPPERAVPGKPLFFATAMDMNGYGTGVLVESHLGRPIKVEGNPDHPASLGATSPFGQSSVLMLYDPDRSKVVVNREQVTDWGAFLAALNSAMATQADKGGAGLRVLTDTVTSPTLKAQMDRLLEDYPQARWHHFDPVGRENIVEGTRLAFGRPLNPIYQFATAQVIVSLDSDFLYEDPGSLRYAREFIDARRVSAGRLSMNRLYVVEPTPTITGSMADHRLPVRAAEVEEIARALARALEVPGVPAASTALPTARAAWIKAAAADLRANAGRGIVVAGYTQPPSVHALAHAINAVLKNTETVYFTEPVEVHPTAPSASLRALVEEMKAGAVDALIIIGGNPAYSAPADLAFGEQLLKLSTESDQQGRPARFTAHLGLYRDETAQLCQWHVPQSHYLESWGDVRAYNGLVSIIQPLTAPLYRSRTVHEFVAALLGDAEPSAYEIVRRHWRGQVGEEGFEKDWKLWLEAGSVAGTELPRQEARLAERIDWPEPRPSVPDALEIVFRPDPTVWDGRFANIAWQQELPKPFTKLTWDNAALIAPRTAQELGLNNHDLARLRYRGRWVNAAVWILPGQAEGTITLHLGYGRTRGGQLADGLGVNAYALRTADDPWFGQGLEIKPTGEDYPLAVTSFFHTINTRAIDDQLQPKAVRKAGPGNSSEQHEAHNRNLVRVGTPEVFREHPDFVKKMEGEAAEKPVLSLYPEFEYPAYKWGMSINLNACIGCNACVVACQAENNIPVVGKTEAARGRAMHWIRVDDYFKGPAEDPELYHMPVPCMHCEKAPCEPVCPVGATLHDSEGLNEMVYNRCVGTRYCSNNCPYKVRRFNYLDYTKTSEPTLKMQRNPDVTVRSRGVMEKCTYCIQRISAARIEADKESRPIRDGEVVPACAQACPTQAIIFGDLNDRSAQVTKLKSSPLDYGILTELTTQPRTTYMPRFRNPNPELEDEGSA